MLLSDYAGAAPAREIMPERVANLKNLLSLSETFHREAGLEYVRPKGGFVIESGHQPNYLPHAGTWKKAFLGNFLSERIAGSVFLFGFADQNLSTAKILSQNHLPAATRTGSVPIGFKIPEKDKWKTFDSIPKPSPEDLEKEITKIRSHYGGNTPGIEEEMRGSYARAKSLSDYNSFLFARILSLRMGVRAYFFRYSDVQKAGLFAAEWGRILENLPEYNGVYNKTVTEGKIEDMHPVDEDLAPFWLHCPCTTKVAMRLSDTSLSGTCPACKTEHSIPKERLSEYLPIMSPAAVSRNMVYSEGLGTSIFLSGAGGGLRYGRISDAVSKALGYNIAQTLCWTGREYYLGPVHKAFLRDLARNTGTDAFADKEALTVALQKKRSGLEEGIRSSQDKKTLQKYEGQKKTLDLMISIAKELFSSNPSFTDELVSLGEEKIVSSWKNALSTAQVPDAPGAKIIRTDQVYSEGADKVFANLSAGP